jgi:hypothetical protein
MKNMLIVYVLKREADLDEPADDLQSYTHPKTSKQTPGTNFFTSDSGKRRVLRFSIAEARSPPSHIAMTMQSWNKRC